MSPIEGAGAPTVEPRAFDEHGRSFINDIGFAFTIADDHRRARGTIEMTPQIMTPSGSRPRLSVLATIADVMVGMTTCLTTLPDVPVTVDLSITMLEIPTTDRIVVGIDLLKLGRSITTAEVRFWSHEEGPLIATGFMTFAIAKDPSAHAPRPATSTRSTGEMTWSFPDHVGLRVLPDGSTQMANGSHLGNAMGGLQGGLVALLGEVAAEVAAGRDVVELDVRYLHSIAVGPGTATAVDLGDDLLRVEVRDPGREDRVCCVIIARTAAHP